MLPTLNTKAELKGANSEEHHGIQLGIMPSCGIDLLLQVSCFSSPKCVPNHNHNHNPNSKVHAN